MFTIHRLCINFTFTGPLLTIEVPLWQQRNPENGDIFQSNRMKFVIKLMLPTYSYPHKGIYVCDICSFYSVTNTTSRNPAMFTLVWYPSLATHASFRPRTRNSVCAACWRIIFHESILIKIVVLCKRPKRKFYEFAQKLLQDTNIN
jgi:hypothetical protein